MLHNVRIRDFVPRSRPLPPSSLSQRCYVEKSNEGLKKICYLHNIKLLYFSPTNEMESTWQIFECFSEFHDVICKHKKYLLRIVLCLLLLYNLCLKIYLYSVLVKKKPASFKGIPPWQFHFDSSALQSNSKAYQPLLTVGKKT